LGFVETIQRPQGQPLKSIFTLTSSTLKVNLLQFIRNVHDFWLPPRYTWDLRSCTLRCLVEQYSRRSQKRIFSSTTLWWCGIVTFCENRIISILKKKKMSGRSTCVWCSICNMTSFTLLTFVPRTIYGMCINCNLSYTSITSHANGVNI